MDIFLQIIILLVGFFLLVKGADLLISGASSMAQNFRISKLIIGLTIVAFGTSLPEFSVSISSLISGSTDMVIGNVIGSNIINALLFVGVAALICPIRVKKNTIRKELPVLLLVSTALAVLLLDVPLSGAGENLITRADALICLLFFALFICYILTSAITARKRDKDNIVEEPRFSLPISFLLVILGLAGLAVGSTCVINSAADIAHQIGVTERIISLTVIALGTGLPELITTIQASRRKEQDLLLGNIIGSNIFNICFVLGVPVALFGTITVESFRILDIIMLIVSALVLWFVASTKHKITRVEGWAMLMIFLAYYVAIFTEAIAL